MKYSVLSTVIWSLISISCINERKVPIYDVNNFNKNNIILDGIPGDKAWGGSMLLKDFKLPWSDEIPQVTIFQALYDSNTLYCYYKAMDKNLVIKDSLNNEIDIASEDRVELFLSKDNTLKEYFCFEIDPLGRVLDYKASYYRKFEDQWDVEGIQVADKIDSESYQIEVAIPLKTIAEMGLDISKEFFVGLFRADFENLAPGIKENWISWVDLGTTTPDFHLPEAFGKFHFVKNR